MKKLEFYEEYLIYLNWRLDENQINKGKFSLLKISKSEYDKFIRRLEIDETFNKKIVEMVISGNRDRKLEEIIEEEILLEDSKNIDISKKIDDFFSEFDI
jgi:flagellar motor component MotA